MGTEPVASLDTEYQQWDCGNPSVHISLILLIILAGRFRMTR